jgi:hypothetical protein
LFKNYQNNSTGDTKNKLNQLSGAPSSDPQAKQSDTSAMSNNLKVPTIESNQSNRNSSPNKNDNPEQVRKKFTLGKGFSLMDWIKFTKETPDLAGNKGILRKITYEEMAKHNKEEDCWLAIGGNNLESKIELNSFIRSSCSFNSR